MKDDTITIDIEKLREDMKNDRLGAFYGGGFGGALSESLDIEDAFPKKLIEKALEDGIELKKYTV